MKNKMFGNIYFYILNNIQSEVIKTIKKINTWKIWEQVNLVLIKYFI